MTKKIGLAPGSAIYTGKIEVANPVIQTITYNKVNMNISENQSYEELQISYKTKAQKDVYWTQIEPISNQMEVEKISSIFGLHSLVVEDLLSVGHRPITEEFDEYTFIIIKYPDYLEGSLNFSQISFILKDNMLISFADYTPDKFKNIQKRLEKKDSRIRNESSQYLLATILDYIVDNYFVVLEKIGEEIEDLEDEIINNPTKNSIEHVHKLKRTLMELKKMIWPTRELLNVLIHSDEIESNYHIYFKDVYEHIINIVDITEGYRDTISSFLDIYLSTLSNRMNEIMKTLSIISTIFIPLSFLTGYFGMNFKYQTILESQSAFDYSNVIMVLIPVGLLLYFKMRKWF
jgi:magnesium transporter